MPHRAVARTLMLLALVLLAACGSEEGEVVNGGGVPTPVETEETGGEPSPVVTEQGGTYWGVYLAIGEGPDIEDAINYLTEERGLEPGQEFSIGDLSCDRGAELGTDAGPMRVAVYFDSQEDAEAWAETLPASPIAIAEVETFCLD
jgi:hypothetical protein